MENEKLMVYYFRGWLRTETMIEPSWFDIWFDSAKKTEESGSTLFVFKIPNDKRGMTDTETVREIEQLLQKKFGIPEKKTDD